jgi:hypothetical protein
MPPYAGYKDLADFIDQQLARASIAQHRRFTRQRLGIEIGRSKNYIHGLCEKQFAPSPDMARALALGLLGEGDAQAIAGAAHIIGVLSGIEQVPPNTEARALADQIMGLSKKKREMAMAFVEWLASQK